MFRCYIFIKIHFFAWAHIYTLARECADGHIFNENTETCEDIDECADGVNGNDACVAGVCINTIGNFICCGYTYGYTGYTVGDDGQCSVDINECDNDNCGVDQCVNTVGSFYCCEGYTVGDDGECSVDIDECGEGVDECYDGMDCVNIGGSYECELVDQRECSEFESYNVPELGDFGYIKLEGSIPVDTGSAPNAAEWGENSGWENANLIGLYMVRHK